MRLLIATVIVMLSGLVSPVYATNITDNDKFVRTANYFLLSGPKLDNPETINNLSKFDLIIIPVEAQIYNQTFFPQIRNLNPDIVILPYVATVSWNDIYWNDTLHQKMYSQINNSWWLTDASQNQKSVWPNTRALNLNTGWSEFLPTFVKNEILSTGYWDGVFYDEVQDSIDHVGNTDIDRNGVNDTAQTANALWANGYEKMFKKTRDLVGSNYIIITNGSSNKKFSKYVNGRMFESFPSSNDSLVNWKNQTNDYLDFEQSVSHSSVQVINVNTDNTGVKNDYQKVRFGLTTTLLGDGYFSFDHGTEDHAQLWTYDEYNAYLGESKSAYKNTLNISSSHIGSGVFEREFENGKVVVNATQNTQYIELDGEFEKLHGLQDAQINDGSIVSEISLNSKDGIILLRPIEQINDATYLNGAFARIYSGNGKTKRTGFFAYDNLAKGGTQVVSYDTDFDGYRETVVADDTYVYIYEEDGSLHAKFAPYTEEYDQGINISIGDIENDGSVEIVTGTERGGGPHVRVFNKDGNLINPGFFAYAPEFRGGVNVAIGDLNGDNIKEIITGAGYNGGPHVRMFKKDGTLINPGFFAYSPEFRGGVNVSSGDIDGDGIDDVITGPGQGGSPLARVYDRNGNLKVEFMIFDKSDTRGLEVVATDLDGDGISEIIGLTTDVFTLSAF